MSPLDVRPSGLHAGDGVIAGGGHVSARPYRPGDEAAIVELYNAVTGRARTVNQHRWEWLRLPDGPGSMWVLEWTDKLGTRVIGHHGLMPVKVSVPPDLIAVGRTENTMVHPDFRQKLVYLRYEREFLEEARERFDMLITTDGAGVPGKIRLALGYVPVGPYSTYVKFTKRSALARYLKTPCERRLGKRLPTSFVDGFSQALSVLAMPAFIGRRDRDQDLSVRELADVGGLESELNELWERTRERMGVTVDRTVPFIRWRYLDNPHVKYRFLAVSRHESLLGYAVVQASSHVARIIDLVADLDDERTWGLIMAAVERELAKQGVDELLFVTLSGSRLSSRLSRNGFRSFDAIRSLLRATRPRPDDPRLMIRLLRPGHREDAQHAKNWYFTEALFEGLG